MINNFKMDFKAVFKSKTIYFVIIFMSLMHLISVYMAKGMPIYESNVTNGFISNIVNNQQSVFAILVVGNLVNIQMKNGIYKIAARGVRNRINIIIESVKSFVYEYPSD